MRLLCLGSFHGVTTPDMCKDQVLSSMQQKLDDLCRQFSNTKEQATAAFNKLPNKDGELQLNGTFGAEKIKFVECSCWHCEQHSGLFNELVLNALVVDEDIYNFKRDYEEKYGSIKELPTVLNTSKGANYKRVAELEDILYRKNSTISKLKKDLVVLEQKVLMLIL